MTVVIQPGEREAYAFLKAHKVGVLATVDPNGEPHAAAIYYAVDRDSSLTFLTKAQTKKADNLEHNHHAMLVVYEAATQTTVQVTGLVDKVTDGSELNDIFTQIIYASLDASNTDVPPIAKLNLGEYVAYRIKPVQVRMASFKQHEEQGNYDSIFKTVVPEHQ